VSSHTNEALNISTDRFSSNANRIGADLQINGRPEALEHLANVETKGNRSFGSLNCIDQIGYIVRSYEGSKSQWISEETALSV